MEKELLEHGLHINRRKFLSQLSIGLGSVALGSLLVPDLFSEEGAEGLLAGLPQLAHVLTTGGVLFLAAYGLRALWRARQSQALQAGAGAAGLTRRAALGQAAAFTLLNPHVYLDTVVLVGTVGAQQGAWRWWFAGGASASSLVWFCGLGYGARWLAPLFARPRAWQVLDALIGVTMLALAAGLAMKF